MHAVVLRTTSEVFRDMLTLPKAVDSNITDTSPEIIPLSEESEVLGTLFRIISGLKFEEWASLEKFKPVLAAAQKYHMEGALDILRRFIPSGPWAEQRPLEVYVIAAQYGWEQIAKIASKHTLALGIREEQHRSMLETIPVEYRQRLLNLHRDRRDRFERMVIKASNGGVECFGKSRCAMCNESWDMNGPMVALAHAMVRSLDGRADGEVLLSGAWKSWQPEYLCESGFCRFNIFTAKNWESYIQSCVNVCVASLPCTI